MRLHSLLFVFLLGFAFQPAAAFDPPTMGWSSWNTYRVHISDSLICRQADAMSRLGLGELGYRYVNIDDGFFGGRAADGRLLVHPHRFPEGLKPVVDYIHSLGFKAGIYSDAGRNTCGNYWDRDSLGVGVGLYGHDSTDANYYFRTLGFDFIKIDFCGGDAKQNHEALDLDERQRYTAIRRAIDAVGRRDVRVNVCRWAFPGTWVSSIGSSWRISGDIAPNWGSVKRIIRENRYLSAYAIGGAFNDMDMLEIGRGLSEAEERTHFGLWCIQSSPLLIGCDLTKIPERSLTLLKNRELIALNQDSLAIQAAVVKVENGVTLYVKDVRTAHGLQRAIALYNPHDGAARRFRLRFSDVDLAGRVTLRNLFTHENLPAVVDSIDVEIPAHDTRIFLLTAERRLEQSVYEAECAWLSRYQELGMNPRLGYAQVEDDSLCSGGAKVTYLGLHSENDLRWERIYRFKGGKTKAALRYRSATPCRLYVSVNGGKPFSLETPASAPSAISEVSFSLRLKKGNNTVRLFSPDEWLPDVDCLVLTAK